VGVLSALAGAMRAGHELTSSWRRTVGALACSSVVALSYAAGCSISATTKTPASATTKTPANPYSDGGGSSTPSCVDTSDKSISCPVKVAQVECAMGDTDSCETTELVQLTVGGSMSPCLHLVFSNGCKEEIYATTCIENTAFGTNAWQCWASSTLPNELIDESECNATGSWIHFSTSSSGELNILNSECPQIPYPCPSRAPVVGRGMNYLAPKCDSAGRRLLIFA
jgi:hypothetical protein